jgi:spermidine synthase
MDIDSAASTPILHVDENLSNVQYLRYELTAVAYHLKRPGFRALVIGPGGGRDLASALVFGAGHVDGVEINPIIANDVMRGRFLAFSGGIYTHPRVSIAVDDGRSFVRRSPDRYDVIQASLVDTWAATAAGAYTLSENTLYTVEAFNDYLDHLADDGVLTITRWVFDGVRLLSLAQAAAAEHGWRVADRVAVIRHENVVTFILKKSPLTEGEIATLQETARALKFEVLYAPGLPAPRHEDVVDQTATGDYARLMLAPDRDAFIASYRQDVSPTTDDRPFFFHTTKIRDQFHTAFGRSMLFGNGLSALLTLMAISFAVVALFVIGPLAIADRGKPRAPGWFAWLAYFGALGAGFMLIEVAVLQQFVLLLGHPVYSLTVTLFALLLGTGLGSMLSRRIADETLRRAGAIAAASAAIAALAVIVVVGPITTWAMPLARPLRMAIAVALLLPMGIALGVPMPTGIRALGRTAPDLVAWAWGINGALSVVGATLAIFIAMNWGFHITLAAAAATYSFGAVAFLAGTRRFGTP